MKILAKKMITASEPNCFFAANSVKDLMNYFVDEEGIDAKQLTETQYVRFPIGEDMEVALIGFANPDDPEDYEGDVIIAFPAIDNYDLYVESYYGSEMIDYMVDYDYPDYVSADVFYDRILLKMINNAEQGRHVTNIYQLKKLYKEAFEEQVE